MFTRQAPIISDSLLQGGLAAPQAYAVTNALGQCRAPLTHRAPIEIDYTSPEMKLILPEQAPIQFPDISLLPPEVPPRRPPNLPAPEEKIPVEPNPLPPDRPIAPIAPPMGAPGGPIYIGGRNTQYDVPPWLYEWMRNATNAFNDLRDAFYNRIFEAGDFLNIDDSSDTIRYELNTENNDQDNVCTFGPDAIVGKKMDDLIDDHSDKILEVVKDENSGVPGNQIAVLTGVSLTASGLEFTQQTIGVLDAGSSGAGPTIPVVDCP